MNSKPDERKEERIEEICHCYHETSQAEDALVLGEIVRAKSNHADYFENWKRRLRSAFKDHELALAITALNHIARHDTMSLAEFHDLSVRLEVEEYRYVLDVLMHDGYISEHEASYGFNSILLKEWWFINVAT